MQGLIAGVFGIGDEIPDGSGYGWKGLVEDAQRLIAGSSVLYDNKDFKGVIYLFA